MPGPVPAPDHLAQLFFRGEAASFGRYTPQRMTLSLAGTDAATDHVVYLHEVHHGGLNDSTAWGAALHLYARLPPPGRDSFLPLLNACRLPHEAFATFAGVSVAAARHESAVAALDHYPAYVPLYDALARLVAGAGGPHRRYMAASALARLSMQTPILQLMQRQDLTVVPADLREIDRPNGRWRWFLRNARQPLIESFASADRALLREHGAAALEADDYQRDPAEAAVEEFDAAWETWERTVYADMARLLSSAGASPLEFNGHLEDTAAVIDLAREIEPRLGLAAQIKVPARDQRTLAAAVTDQVRLTISPEPWKAALVDFSTEELVSIVDESSRIGDTPSLVVSGRLPHRMLELYRWNETHTADLEAARSPLLAVRVIADDGSGGGIILHSLLRGPADLRALVDA